MDTTVVKALTVLEALASSASPLGVTHIMWFRNINLDFIIHNFCDGYR